MNSEGPLRPDELTGELTEVQIAIINRFIRQCYMPCMKRAVIRWTILADALGLPYDYMDSFMHDLKLTYVDWKVTADTLVRGNERIWFQHPTPPPGGFQEQPAMYAGKPVCDHCELKPIASECGSKCGTAYYCGQECADAHFEEHQKHCH